MELAPIKDAGLITKQWFQDMISNYSQNKVEVINFIKYEDPSTSQGFLSSITNYEVIYEINAEVKKLKLVLKFMPSEEPQLSLMNTSNLAQREVDFYTLTKEDSFESIIGGLSCVPEVLYSGYKNGNLTIAMKDMRELGYNLKIVGNGFGFDETICTLKSIASIHAAGLLHLSKTGGINLPSIAIDDSIETLFKDGLKIMACQVDNGHQKEVLIHGDLWAGQILYHDNVKKPVCILDWQFAAFGNPVIDLVTFFSMSCDPHMLDSELDKLIDVYLAALQEACVSCPVTRDDIRQNVDKLWIHGFMMTAASIQSLFEGNSISVSRLKTYLNFVFAKDIFTSYITNQ